MQSTKQYNIRWIHKNAKVKHLKTVVKKRIHTQIRPNYKTIQAALNGFITRPISDRSFILV